ncbi:MAG: hypothetical protein QW041_01870 [Candidatus Pacearchaeota archaeon]
MRLFFISGLIAFSLILISSITAQCVENWQCFDWSHCINGITERRCFDINSCGTYTKKPFESADCKEIWQLCFDGVQNQDETDVDCGGKICDKCNLEKSCFRNDDCIIGSCIKNTCILEEIKIQAAPLPNLAWISWTLATIIFIALILILLAMKKLKRAKSIILIGKKIKEDIKISMSVQKKSKKNRLNRFIENFNEYIENIKPKKRTEKSIIKREQKDLLNKNSYKKQEISPIKEFMLSELKEVYN